jgi:hypothetical protein
MITNLPIDEAKASVSSTLNPDSYGEPFERRKTAPKLPVGQSTLSGGGAAQAVPKVPPLRRLQKFQTPSIEKTIEDRFSFPNIR